MKGTAACLLALNLLRQRGGKDGRSLLGGLKAWMNQGWSTMELKAE